MSDQSKSHESVFIMWLQTMTLSCMVSNDVFSWVTMIMSLSFIIY